MNFVKLYQAIELVAYNRLDECRDDTLIEKLVTVFDATFESDDVQCSNDQLISIFSDRFIFKLISTPQAQQVVGKKPIILELQQLIALRREVFNKFDSIQFSYVKGLSKLFASKEGSRLVFEERLIDESFVQSLISCGIESKSFFVKESIQQCLVELLRRSAQFDQQLVSSYFQLIISSFELKLSKFQTKIIGQLMQSDARSTLLKLFPDLNSKLINHISPQTDENVLIQLAELLAFNLEDESQINFVFIKLLKNKLLKPLITFSTNLASRNSSFLNEWFTYVVLPLDPEKSQEVTSCFKYSELDHQLVKSLTNEKTLIYCLHYLKINFPKHLSSQQLNQVFEIISRFVNRSIVESKIKLLRESLLMIGNLGKQLNELEPKQFSVLVDLLINLLWSENFQCECLIWLRNLFESSSFKNCDRLISDEEIKTKVTKLVDQILKLELKDENFDVIDGGLELLDVLVRNDYLRLDELDEQVLRSIFNIWNHSTQHSDNYSLKASCVSILLSLRMQLDNETLKKLTIHSSNGSTTTTNSSLGLPNDILEIIWKCLKDENSLVRRKVIESIRESLLFEDRLKEQAIDQLMREDGKLYLDVCYHVSESVLFDIDADIQLAAVNLLKQLVISVMDETGSRKSSGSGDEVSKIKYKGLILFIHCLHFTIVNNLVCFTVKEECISVLELVKQCLDLNSVSKIDLISALGSEESVFEYQVSGHEQSDCNGSSTEDVLKKREEELNEIFKDNLFRTEEIIAQFTKARVEQVENSSLKEMNDHQTSITNKMNIESLLDFLFTFDPRSILNNEIKVDFLDDILAARANDDVIIDCY